MTANGFRTHIYSFLANDNVFHKGKSKTFFFTHLLSVFNEDGVKHFLRKEK